MRSIPTQNLTASTSFPKATIRITKAAVFYFFTVLVLLTCGAAAVRAQSALDGFNPNANGVVRVVVVQPDGKILIGGDFSTVSPNGAPAVSRNCIARLNPDGTLDTAFNPNANGTVRAIAVQADGKIVIGGVFTDIGGQPRNNIARLDATSGLADSFNPNADFTVRSIAVQADGKILVGGAFTTIGGQARNRMARLDATSGLADSFNPNGNGDVRVIAVQTDGKILAGGEFTTLGGQPRTNFARLDPTSGLADSISPNPNDFILAIAVQADGRILLGGFFTNVGGQPRSRIARLDPVNGSVDSFDPNAVGGVSAIVVQADGKILVGGSFANVGGQPRSRIARLDPVNGSVDSFDPNPDAGVNAIAVQADGKILAGGDFTSVGAQPRNRIARLETDGRLDLTISINPFGSNVSYVRAIAVQPDGKILIGGFFGNVFGVARSNIARLNTDGTLDMTFNPNANDIINDGDGEVNAIAVQTDGQILVGGAFTSVGGQVRNRIARLNPVNGAADMSFNPNANSSVFSIAVQPNGEILAGGAFTSIGGQLRNHIARLNSGTGLADSFNPNANGVVNAIAVQADGKILVGGAFNGANSIGGQTRNRIARLDATTGLADSFDPNANSVVLAIVIQADGKILVGGQFATIGSQVRLFLARLDAITGLADSFNPNSVAFVFSIAVQADGKVITGGNFTNIGGQPRNRIARLDGSTGLADSFNPNANGDVTSIAVQADGKILTGGVFSNIGGQPRDRLARLSNDTAALQDLVATQTTINWSRAGSSPQFSRVTFESSNDNVNYTPLGNGSASGGQWMLTGLNLQTGTNLYIRARGYYRSGYQNSSEGITQFVRNVFIAGATSPVTIQLSSSSYSVSEGSQSVDITITRSGDTTLPASVSFTTSDTAGAQNCNVVTGVASSRCDYQANVRTVQFASGETAKNVPILIVDDSRAEGSEVFTVSLSNPTGGTLGSPSTASVTITDNETTSGSNPIDTAGFFVRQHYFDFLNRVPDSAGLAFWTNEITSCGSDAQCIEVKRINVSASFYLSIEFQQTGYLIHRVYKVSYGNASGTSTLGGPHQLVVPIIRLNEFLSDTQQMGQGVIVGQPGWEQLLENNKQTFFAEFVQRSRFASAFPSTTTPAQFVDALFANAGVTPSAADRQAAISEFGGAGSSSNLPARGRALRRVAENGLLAQQEFNRAFVLMQYFGYLRRNPNDPQDSDYTGYEFWLNKLNQFNGNFIEAEMVKAFLTSIEYRQRFSQ